MNCDVNVETYIKGEMILHFSHISLKQRGAVTPIIFSGPGNVYLKNGLLKYVIYHTCVDSEMRRHMALSFSGQAGELVNESSLFDFVGTSVKGKIWTSESVDTSGGEYTSKFCIVEGSIEFIKCIEQTSISQENALHQVYFNNAHFPSSIATGEDIEFLAGESTIALTRKDLSCDVWALRGHLCDDFAKAIEKSLNVLCGVRFQLGITQKIWAGLSVVELYSRDIELNNQQLSPPVEIFIRHSSEKFAKIFNLFMNFFQQRGSLYYDNWYKLNRAWQSGLESAALNVSVCIEGTLKAYYKELGTDRDFGDLSKLAMPIVSELALDERVKNLLIACLGGSGNFKPKTALHRLTTSNIISPGLAVKWNKLRSETAHAVVAGEAREDWQRLVDLTYANIKLFYEILFSLIGYTEERIDYEVRGFPSKSFPDMRCRINL